MFQNLTRRDFNLSEQDYFSQVDGKTAALFEAGGQLAAYYAGAVDELQQAAATHGLLSGRAFQVVDDLLDLEGDEEQVGKSLGTDWARGKMTLPIIRLRDGLSEDARKELEVSFNNESSREDLLKGSFSEQAQAAIQACRKDVDVMLDEAANQLNGMPEREIANDLGSLTRFLGQRNR